MPYTYQNNVKTFIILAQKYQEKVDNPGAEKQNSITPVMYYVQYSPYLPRN
jgi:hypothetical protein